MIIYKLNTSEVKVLTIISHHCLTQCPLVLHSVINNILESKDHWIGSDIQSCLEQKQHKFIGIPRRHFHTTLVYVLSNSW